MTDSMMHYGVPGMRWGKRKAADGGSSRAERKAEKRAKSDERDANITKARENLKTKSQELERVAASTYSARSETGRRRAEAQYDKLEREFFDGPDFAVANQRTRGEQISDNFAAAGYLALTAAGVGLMVVNAARR